MLRAQATLILFGKTTGQAVFQAISVPQGCTYKIIGQRVALPAKGVTITGRSGVGNNTTVTFDHTGIAPGTPVSIQLEVHCTCNSVVSQNFLFARGTK